jgi:hypothetical protein
VTNRIHLLSAALLLAGCSSAAQEAPNTAIVTQSGPQLASTFNSAPDNSGLDGAPSTAPAPAVPSVLMRATEPLPPPVLVKKVVQRLSCDIDVRLTSHGIRVTPVVHAVRSISGEYSLVITKSGAAGSSDINQGGPFDAARGQTVELGTSEFTMERGAKFRAVLKVRAGGEVVCRDIRS